MSSAIVSPPIQVARIENNNIAARESVNISVISVNVYQRDQRASRLPTNPGQNGEPELIGKAAMLETVARKLERTLHSGVDSSGEYLALSATLERISEVTIPRIITLASRSRLMEAVTKVKLLTEVDCLLLLLKEFSRNPTRKPSGLKLDLKPRPTKLSKAYAARWPPCRTLSDKINSKIIKKLHRELERSCGRADSILLSLFKDPAPNVLQEQTEIEDFFGARWFLPQYICLDQQAFNAALFAKFKGGIAENVINQGRFKVSTYGRLKITNPNDWERIISAGDSIQLSVFVQCLREKDASRVCGTIVQCPRCRHPQTIRSEKYEGWVDCGQCQSSFTVNFREALDKEGVQALQSPRASGSYKEAHPCENGSFRYFTVENILVYREPISEVPAAPHKVEPQSEQLMGSITMESILSSDFWDSILVPGYNDLNGVTGGYPFRASDSGQVNPAAVSSPSVSQASIPPSNLRWDQGSGHSLPQTNSWPAWTPTFPVQQQQSTQYQDAGWLHGQDLVMDMDNEWRRFIESLGDYSMPLNDYLPSTPRNNTNTSFLQTA